jgi:hypothetical protein
MSALKALSLWMLTVRPTTVFKASTLYREKFLTFSSDNYFQAISRLAKQNKLIKIAKGMYMIPVEGPVMLTDEQRLSLYVKNQKYFESGYAMFNRLGLSTQISKQRVIYLNHLDKPQMTVSGHLVARKILRFENHPYMKTFELLDVLNYLNQIQDLSMPVFYKFTKERLKAMDEKTFHQVMNDHYFRKRTIAVLKFLAKELNLAKHYFDQYLSPFSTYQIPSWMMNREIR